MDDLLYHQSVARLARAAGEYGLACAAGERLRLAQAQARRAGQAVLDVDVGGRAITVNGKRFERAPRGALLVRAALGRRGFPTCWAFHFDTANSARNAITRFAEWLAERDERALADIVRSIQVYGSRRPAADGTPDPLDCCVLLDA